jgi:ABC-type glycerol-3-phosphate transport system substrate-binding protein
MRKLQFAISVVLGFFVLIAVMVFAGFIPSPGLKDKTQLTGKLVLWGSEDSQIMASYLEKVLAPLNQTIKVAYKKKSVDTFAEELIEALAAGEGPDMIFLPQDLIIRLESKITPFATEVYSERDFKNAFIENGEIFIQPKGILALPITVDPMVMYWNRDIFTPKSIVRPPKYWDEFLLLAPVLTEKNATNDILKSTIAFGEFGNVTNAKGILSTLILQTGNPILMRIENSNVLSVTLLGVSNAGIPPISEVLRFYTSFADPVKNIYSWNRSLPDSKKAFLAGDLAVYFGYASELYDIKEKSPNLNFDVAPIPQIRDYPRTTTFGKIQGFAVLNVSAQKNAAFYAAKLLAAPEASAFLSGLTKTPSPSRAVLSKTSADPYMKVFDDAAIISRSWLDPNREKTTEIFQTTIESVNSGKIMATEVVGTMHSRFSLLLPMVE